MLCEHRVVDTGLLKSVTGLDESSIQRIVGALLSSGYIVEVEPRAGPCASCPLSSVCWRAGEGAGVKFYALSRRLERLCDDLRYQERTVQRAGCGG